MAFPPDYDFTRSTFRFRAFGDDLASRWHDGGLHRVLRSGLAVRITAAGPVWYGSPSVADEAELQHVLGMGFDLEGFARAYPDVYARAAGFRPPLVADPFESLVTAVTAQQVSLKAACAIRNRFTQRFGRRVEHDGFEWYRFAEQADVRGGDLEGVGLSRAKVRTIAALTEADLDLTGLDDEAIRERLLVAARHRPMDGGLAARPLPGPARRIRARRSGRAQGRCPVVLGRSHLAPGAGARGHRPVRPVRQPRGALPAPARRRLAFGAQWQSKRVP